MSRLEQDRDRVVSDPRFNQRLVRATMEGQERFAGSNDKKGRKSEQLRGQDERFVQDWIKKQSELNLRPKQRFDLALKRGNDTDVRFIFNHWDDLEQFGYRVGTHT